MGSKLSKAKHPIPVKAKTATIPRIPQEIVDEILAHLAADFGSLRSCALVSRSWVPSCRRHLFHTITFTSRETYRWLEIFPVPEQSPAHHIRRLGFWTGLAYEGVPAKFFEYTPWFTNAKVLTLSGFVGFQPSQMSLSWRFPKSVTSLIVRTGVIDLPRIWDIMALLPNLDDLSLSGDLTDSRAPAGVGTTLSGKFGGRLELLDGIARKDVMSTLLEVPTGLHFTEIGIRCVHKCLLPTIGLVEACGRTLVKLSYTDDFHDALEAPERPFDFSEFSNLQEVEFRMGWTSGGLFWLPTTLSTLKPPTSPRLSVIQLDFFASSVSIEDVRKGLWHIANEATRIEREFRISVNFTVYLGPGSKVVLSALEILAMRPSKQIMRVLPIGSPGR